MTERADERSGRGRPSAGLIGAIIGLALLLIFVLQNTEVIQFRFLWLSFGMPLWLYTIGVALVGGLIWFGLGVVRRHRRRVARRQDRA
jgi:uncharacterized integral membrane protein